MKCLQYGCGCDVSERWINYDASPMIIIRRIPLLGKLVENIRGVYFPPNVLYGNIIKGFLKHRLSCSAVYCSHVLEHLTYDEMLIALKNTHNLLMEGGVFRFVMPDLQLLCESYVADSNLPDRATRFMKNCGLGVKQYRKGLISRIQSAIGNSRHCWLWDYNSIVPLLHATGFNAVRRCSLHDSDIKEFMLVENPARFVDALAVEAKK